MRLLLPFFTVAASLAMTASSYGEEIAALEVTSSGIMHGARIPDRYVFCKPDAANRTADGGNISPEIRWSAGPAGTKSYALWMVDGDVPTAFDDANQEGKLIPADMPRKAFYHWVLANIPATITRLPEGAEGVGVRKPGKGAASTPNGDRGVNDYTAFFGATYAGYDGPCPPWNDERLHHYHFQVFALDVEKLTLRQNFNAVDLANAMRGHILAQGHLTATYTQNPGLIK